MNGRRYATADIRGDAAHPGLWGRVSFAAHPDGVLVTADIRGLPESETGFYGFHIHEGGGCGGEGLADTGSHYNPQEVPHPRHAGDLPPLLGFDGIAYMMVLTNRFSLEEVVGRAVVIHSGPDDFRSQPAGNAGTKIACGVIRQG